MLQTSDNPIVSNEWRPWPFFVLNDEFLPVSGEKRLSEFLENLKEVGYGGVFIHPRPGLMTEYLGARWFEIVRHIIAECRRLGLHPALYDENSYPSGFAGGHVPAKIPDAIVRAVTPVVGTGRVDLPVSPLALYEWDDECPGGELNRESVREDQRWLAFVVKTMEPSAWHGGFTYVSLLDPQVVPAFLDTTHERYRAELSEGDWQSLRAIFTDEPHLPAEHHGSWSAGLHFTPWVRAVFKNRCGYDLADRLPQLYWNLLESAAVRFDYYETLHELWVRHWARPLQQWCEKNRLPLTGHYLEHDWPCPYATPGHVHMLKFMDWPGTDLLENYLLEGHEGGDPQNLTATKPGREPQALYYLKQVQSVANQFCKERVVCESWGAGGNDSTPADWLRIGRFLIVHGVNLLVPHLSPVTIRGSRKTDHPQFFSEHHPAFRHFKPMNDEFGRLCEFAGRGRMETRILLVDPLTTGYCLSAKSDCIGMERHHDESLRPEFVALTQRSLGGLRESTTLFAQALSEASADLDIGDEYILAEDGSAEAGCLVVANQKYECVVLPPQLRNLRAATVELLESYLGSGGKLIAVRPLEPLMNGRAEDWPSRLDLAGSVCWVDDAGELVARTLSAVPPRVRSGVPFPPGWAHQRRIEGETVRYLFVNSGPKPWEGSVEVAEDGLASLVDPATGTSRSFATGGTVRIEATAAQILVIDRARASSPKMPEKSAPAFQTCDLTLLSVMPGSQNVWVIDTCSSRINDRQYPEELVYASNRRYWNTAGMAMNGWHMVIQFRDQMFRRAAELDPRLTAEFHYEFEIAPGLDSSAWEAGIEAPELWEISVNGKAVDFTGAGTWRDCHLLRRLVGQHLQPGKNRITLATERFHPLHEVDQIYLFGNFSLEPCAQGFRAVAPAPPGLGSWKKDGRPFYDGEMIHDFQVGGNGEWVRIMIPRGQWSGSVVRIESGDHAVPSYGPDIDVRLPLAADRRLRIRVVGLPLNLFGPFRVSDPRPKRAWSVQWSGPGIPEEPLAGTAYRLLDLGLFALPEAFVG